VKKIFIFVSCLAAFAVLSGCGLMVEPIAYVLEPVFEELNKEPVRPQYCPQPLKVEISGISPFVRDAVNKAEKREWGTAVSFGSVNVEDECICVVVFAEKISPNSFKVKVEYRTSHGYDKLCKRELFRVYKKSDSLHIESWWSDDNADQEGDA
jgi:hypothetical protein